MNRKWKWLRPAVWGFYLVVVLEFLFMISPFALHFYSAYGPTLNLLNRSPATAWMTGFFLPHFSMTSSPLLDRVKPTGFLLAEVGLALFLIGVVQIYGAKLLRRGAVTGGLYRFVRHPQYLALAILGLGVTLIWPRFLVLLSFLAMLFVYYALARWEERQCVDRFGDGYRAYQRKTGMIFPRLVPRPTGRTTPFRLSWQSRAAAFVAVSAAAVAIGFWLRGYSLDHVSSYFTADLALLSPARLDENEILQAYRTATADGRLDALLEPEPRVLAYVVPADWFLPDLPLHTEDEIRRVGGGHRTPATRSREYRVLFTRPRLHAASASGRAIVTRAHGLEPLAIVRVDLDTGEATDRDKIPNHVIWGDIPTPLF